MPSKLILLPQVLCNEAGVPIDEMRDDDVAARELTLDSKMRAFFRLSNFSHRYMAGFTCFGVRGAWRSIA